MTTEEQIEALDKAIAKGDQKLIHIYKAKKKALLGETGTTLGKEDLDKAVVALKANDNIEVTPSDVHICTICNKIAASKAGLSSHMRSHKD